MKFSIIKSLIYTLSILMIFQIGFFFGMTFFIEGSYASPPLVRKLSRKANDVLCPFLWENRIYQKDGIQYEHRYPKFVWENKDK